MRQRAWERLDRDDLAAVGIDQAAIDHAGGAFTRGIETHREAAGHGPIRQL